MRFKNVAVGGTFDNFHKGHKRLIEKAVAIGEFVTIGITGDRFSNNTAGVGSHASRKIEVENFLSELEFEDNQIILLNDIYGSAIHDESLEALVVSEETYENGVKINMLRAKKGLKQLELIRVSMVLAEDGSVLSSSKIRSGEIDIEGRRR